MFRPFSCKVDSDWTVQEARKVKKIGMYPYFRPLSSAAGPEVMVNGKKMIMIGSNNYLGLTTHPKVVEASIKAIEKYGTGCTGSRFLNGTLDIHEDLEAALAKFVRKERALVFSTGFQTNLGTISALCGKDDIIVCDRLNHASIVDGCRLSFSDVVKYKHNDMDDLDESLKGLDGKVAGSVLLVTDGIFSMEGDIVNLPGILRLKKKFGFTLMIDDAHALGVLGDHGRGTANHFKADSEADLIMGTFSKSFSSIGGFIAGSADLIDYIQHHARSMIFSAAMAPSCVATVKACLDIMATEEEPHRRLWENTKKMQTAYKQMGFNTGHSASPVIPIIIGNFRKVFEFWKALFDEGIYVNPVMAPAVPEDMALLRTSYIATHTTKQLDTVLATFEKVGKKLSIIK